MITCCNAFKPKDSPLGFSLTGLVCLEGAALPGGTPRLSLEEEEGLESVMGDDPLHGVRNHIKKLKINQYSFIIDSRDSRGGWTEVNRSKELY